MALLRLQNKVPNIYVDQSRDFQLLCRLYDVILNGVKYDVDGISRIINTHDCKSTILQLLQTKLGFFTSYNFTDTTVRYILECFPVLVKRKGTRLAIEQAVYMFLKINGLETRVQVDIISDTPTKAQKRVYGKQITDHCVVIGIDSQVKDVTPLKEVLRYIIPFGYNLFFYFFTGQEAQHEITHAEKIEWQLISNDVNDMAGSKSRIVKNLDGTYKDWPTNINLTISSISGTEILTTTELITETASLFGYVQNKTNSEISKVRDIIKIDKTTYKIILDSPVTWQLTDEITYSQEWYAKAFEEREVSAVNTTEVRRESYTDSEGEYHKRDEAKEILNDSITISENLGDK